MSTHDVRLTDLRMRQVLPLWLAGVFVAVTSLPDFGYDSHAYWMTAHRAELYDLAPGVQDSFLYSPVFAQVVSVVAHPLPWLAFGLAWSAAEALVFAWLFAPLGWRAAVPAVLCCGDEIMRGNVYAFLAASIVIGMRRPAAWAFPLLTKITPGLGLVWFAARYEWRRFVTAVGATAALVAVSVAISPQAWGDWFDFLASHRSGGSLMFPVRFALAVIITVAAARWGETRLLAVSALLALPITGGLTVLTVLAAIPRLRKVSPVGGTRGTHQSRASGSRMSASQARPGRTLAP